MPTNFPGADDVFDEPASPAATPLGDVTDEHTDIHENLGDAVMAMQAQATLSVHSHDGSTARHGSKLTQANTHQSPDTDSSASSLHHTLDNTLASAVKGAKGDHSHGAVNPYPIGSIFISDQSTDPSTYFAATTWVAITGRFLVAAGSTFTAGSTGGSSSSHTHTNSTTGSDGGHSHTSASTGTNSTHTHFYSNATGTSTFTHSHGGTSSASSGSTSAEAGSGVSPALNTSHSHGVNTSDASHSHTLADTGSSGAHSHTIPASSSQSNHTHTWGDTGSAAHLPAYLVVYMWRRSA